jgi:hypothetical protein
MASILLVVLLAVLLIQFLRIQRDIERRIVLQRNTPRDQLVPRHYKSFTEVEKTLWEAVQQQQQQKRSTVWEDVRFKGQEPEFQIVQDYLRRVREDFRRGHRIYGQVIIHSPELKIFAELEWHRMKIEFAYYRWCALAWLRLKTVGISIHELRQLTEIVATLAFRVRSMLSTFENSGNVEFVDSILRQS